MARRFIFRRLLNEPRTALFRLASIILAPIIRIARRSNRRSPLVEGGAIAAAFPSGLAAAPAVFQALAPNDHVLAPLEAYHGVLRLLRDIFTRWRLEVDFVDMTDLDAIKKAIRPKTKIIWVETPSNPTLKLTDLAAVAEIAHAAGARLVVDNTWCPMIQRPFALGADLVMHSTTKYFGGHSDVMGGAIIARQDDEFFQRVREAQKTGGAVPAPFDCWLVHRGLQTLPWRMRAHCENARRVAAVPRSHPKVARVHYPGLPSHPQHDLAATADESVRRDAFLRAERRSRRGDGAAEPTPRIFTRATSLGGVESLIEHRQSIEGPDTRTPETLLRLSIGLEHPDDLIADLERALDNPLCSCSPSCSCSCRVLELWIGSRAGARARGKFHHAATA